MIFERFTDEGSPSSLFERTEMETKTIVTQRASMPDSVVAVTPETSPTDVHVVAMPWWQIVGVRVIRTYLTTLIGLLSAAGVGADNGILPHEFMPLLMTSAKIALAPAVMSLLLNTVELLARVDTSFPQLRG